MSAIIKCDNVSIRYITGDFKDIGIKEYLIRRLKGEYRVTEFWADRHVTFELQPGDMLGIIGSNGAGKSTLLKAISGIMVPTEGTVECHGKIAALLELASGFDGDLTVRENTYLRAAMLGYSRAFVDATYDSIIDFAELRDFQDRPFKQLSSGMKSRLAFSIASLVDPEVLILDEVLSVGDGAFRKKSEAKMRQIIGGGATTILVSHSVAQVRALCNKVLWLDRGRQIAFGTNVQGLCDAYQAYLDTRRLPGPDELPPFDVEAPAPTPAGEPAGALTGEGSGAADPSADSPAAAPSASAASGAVSPDGRSDAGRAVRSRRGRLRRLPKAARIALVALALLTAVIAVSEATLPGRVRALAGDEARTVYAAADGTARVCVWENKLYLFMDRAEAEGAVFYLRAVDNHGKVTADEFAVASDASRRFSTSEEAVLEVNLARYTGYVEVSFGQVDTAQPASDGSAEPALLWEGIYERGEVKVGR